ncbi:MAG: phenylacetate--CoA ligase family protein, partial [Armatimonadetes bacterium]|nr:phenylacetate--CoA ligase family protein [Armatimonadota bacterium]
MAAKDSSFYKPSEGRPQADRLREQEASLRMLLAKAIGTSVAVRAALAAAAVPPGSIALADLERLPLVRKEQLPSAQAQAPPFGGWLGRSVGELRRIFVSPGPIYDPEGHEPDYWGFAPALYAAGFRGGDLVMNTFSYHLTPAGAMFDGALAQLGCVTIPSGVGNLEIQVKTLLDLEVAG